MTSLSLQFLQNLPAESGGDPEVCGHEFIEGTPEIDQAVFAGASQNADGADGADMLSLGEEASSRIIDEKIIRQNLTSQEDGLPLTSAKPLEARLLQ